MCELFISLDKAKLPKPGSGFGEDLCIVEGNQHR